MEAVLSPLTPLTRRRLVSWGLPEKWKSGGLLPALSGRLESSLVESVGFLQDLPGTGAEVHTEWLGWGSGVRALVG